MGLKIRGWRKYVKIGGVAFLVTILAAFFIRVAIFEQQYYNEKEGSERAETIFIEEEVELEETAPTEEEVKEYVVSAERPRYLSIDKLGIVNARVLAMGVSSNNELLTPNNIFDVGWYSASGKPGEGKTMLINGHNGGPNVLGVFKDLPSLVEGDLIVVERGDGVRFTYVVVETKTLPLGEASGFMASAMRSPKPGKEALTLISCTGEWSQVRRTYLSRQFVRAVLSS